METTQTWKIGDCLDLLPTIETDSIDMILTDLPYGTTACKWDTIIPFEPLWNEYKRILSDKGATALFGTEPFCTHTRMSNIEMYKYDWMWIKNDATDCMNAKNKPMRKVEKIMIFSNGTTANKSNRKMRYNPQNLKECNIKRCGNDYGKTRGSFKQHRPSHHAYTQKFTNYPTDVLNFVKDKSRIHPTQKPVALFEYLIKTYTNEGDTVHDSCLGSGTTLEACRNTNRNCIGFEIRDEWEHFYPERTEPIVTLDNFKYPYKRGTK